MTAARRPQRARTLLRGLGAAVACVLVTGGLPGARVRPRAVLSNAGAPRSDLGERTASVRVRVHDRERTPLAGASVVGYAVIDGRAHVAGAQATGADGIAALTRLPTGEAWIVAHVPGYARRSAHVVLLKGGRDLAIELGPEHRLELAVRDDEGQPVADAIVELTGADPLPLGARTDARGRALVGRLGPAPWTVSVRAAGFDEVVRRVVREDEPMELTLRRLGTLVVTVTGPDATPAVGATVHIAGALIGPARATETGRGGEAKIAGLPAGAYAVRAVHGELVSPVELGVALGRGEPRHVALRLVRGRVMAVRVVEGDDDAAATIAGARVTLTEGGLSPFPLEAATDRHGKARLGPILEGPATLGAQADGFVAQSMPVPDDADDHEVRIALQRGATLAGRVVDARGVPIGGATIEIVGFDVAGGPIDDDPRTTRFRQAHFDSSLAGPARLIPAGPLGVLPGPVPPIPRTPRSDMLFGQDADTGSGGEPWVTRGDGTFRAAPISPGTVRALGRHPQFVDAFSEAVVVGPGAQASVTVVMHQGGALEGRVVDDRDTPVSAARVSLVTANGLFERATSTDDDGSFAFAAVPDPVVLTVMTDDGGSTARLTVTVPEGGRRTLTVTVPASRPALPVRVTDDRGYPVERAQISAISLDPSTPFRTTAFSDARGEAALGGLKGLAARVEVRALGYGPKTAEVSKEASAFEVSLELAESAAGEVRVARNGKPVADAEVVLYTELGPRRAHTDGAGRFVFPDLAPGAARLRVRAPGYATLVRTVQLEAPDARRAQELPRVELVPEAVVVGRVVDGRGEPVPYARVARDHAPTYLTAGRPPSGIAVADARGEFRLGELEQGFVALEAYRPEVGRGRIEAVGVEAGRTTANVTIRIERASADRAPEAASIGGLAVTLGEQPDARRVSVASVLERSEAERAGIAPGDELVAIDGAPVDSVDGARARLAGPPGDDVRITVRRGERIEHLVVPRERVRK